MTSASDPTGDFDSQTVSRKFTGVWIPREIYLREDISALEKMLWAEIHSLESEEYGGCYASEKYLCKFLGVERRQFYRYLKNLKDLGLIEDVHFNGRLKIRKAILPQPVKKGKSQQQCHECHTTSDISDTHPIYTKSKVYNKDIEQEQCASASTTRPPTEEKIFVSSDLDGNDLKKGTLKIPQAKWDAYVKQHGAARVNRCATELSNYIVKTGMKYKSHYLALNSFIKNSIEKEKTTTKNPAAKKDFRDFPGNYTMERPPETETY